MALKSGLAVWCYTPPGATFYGPSIIDYSKQVESLKFSTVSPGGYGQLSCTIKVADSRQQRPELALFSRIVVMAHGENGPYAVFIGEISDPEISFDGINGESWNIQALGIGNCLRDDPQNFAYKTKTAQFIIVDQMTHGTRPTQMPLDTDLTACFPDNPSATYSPSYSNYSIQDIIGDVCLVTGDYAWGVWQHPGYNPATGQHADGYGFPTAQLQIHLRNTTTTNYQAFVPDIQSWKISPTAERAYNNITIWFDDKNSTDYDYVQWQDARINVSNNAQAAAPFRFRRFVQDFSGIQTVNTAQATAIANTYGAEMENVQNKVQMVLRNVRNGLGQPIPLWTVTADGNIFVPELAQRAQILTTSAQPAVNQFYIISAEYSEDSGGQATLTLQCDNWYDYAQKRIARLQMKAYNETSNSTIQPPVISTGGPDSGKAGGYFYAAVGGVPEGVGFSYHGITSNAPTSITLSGISSSNASGAGLSSIGVHGAHLTWTAPIVGVTFYFAQWTTVGNCILDVDLDGGTFDHHCEMCNTARTKLPILEHIQISVPHGEDTPGKHGLSVECPTCGALECFNTALLPADEVVSLKNPRSRAEMSALIRKMQSHGPLQSAIMAMTVEHRKTTGGETAV